LLRRDCLLLYAVLVLVLLLLLLESAMVMRPPSDPLPLLSGALPWNEDVNEKAPSCSARASVDSPNEPVAAMGGDEGSGVYTT